MKFKEGITRKNPIVKCSADMILPFAVVFGVYIVLFGTSSPGGGFQGGVVIAAATLLLYLGHGYGLGPTTDHMERFQLNEASGATVYVVLGALGIILGSTFAENVFAPIGHFGNLISGGTITLMGYTVGFKVLTGISFLLLLMMSLLNSDDDEEKEGQE